MTNAAILTAAGLLLFAYLVDIVGRKFRLPSVVLLIFTGIALRQVADAAGFHLGWVDPVVPVIGTLGLILIVLEGALDLTVARDRTALIAVSSTAALAGFLVTLGAFAVLFSLLLGLTPAVAALAAMPFAVISSAVAIPSSIGLPPATREFVVYESSLSDIIGVLVFYAWLEADDSLAHFGLVLFGGGLVSLVVAVFAALGLFYLINRVEGHVRFLPLIAGLIFLYAVGKAAHLSPLVLILVCGLLLNNPHLLEWSPRLIALHGPDYDRTLREFKGIVAELTFATKSFFFLLLGYWTELRDLASWPAWTLALEIIAIIFASRYLLLALLRLPERAQLVWLAPRGLITVLLFLSAAKTGLLAQFPLGTVMLVVLISAAATGLAHRGPAKSPAVEPESAAKVPSP